MNNSLSNITLNISNKKIGFESFKFSLPCSLRKNRPAWFEFDGQIRRGDRTDLTLHCSTDN